MKTALLIALSMCLAAEAAETPTRTAPVTQPGAAAARKPLNLRIGEVRSYMMPYEYRAALSVSDADRYAIVVEGHRPSAEVQSLRAVPMGLGALLWGFRHPSRAWRMFLPDVNAPSPGPVLTRVPPPVFRPGP